MSREPGRLTEMPVQSAVEPDERCVIDGLGGGKSVGGFVDARQAEGQFDVREAVEEVAAVRDEGTEVGQRFAQPQENAQSQP